jgi:hypothetical protein
MGVMSDIAKLVVLIGVLAAIVFGIHHLGTQVDNKTKYQHPITKPGAGW